MPEPDDPLKTASWKPGDLQDTSREAPPSERDVPTVTLPPAAGSMPECTSSIALPASGSSPLMIPGYAVLGAIARGGMGVVYRARDLSLNRLVAIKMPRPGYLDSDQDKERFLREARSAARLRHANICPIYEVREAAGQPYICMALIDGTTLREWRAEQKPGPRQIAELMASLARAVQYAHSQGVVHRDLKPSNVMVESRTSQPMLMDFGLAKDLSQGEGLTMSGELLGTPAYMAPEQASGRAHEMGPATDVYGLGAILYELLAGRPPFAGTLAEVLEQVRQEEPLSPRKITPSLAADLETICQKAMAKRAADRYSSADAMAEDLERFARGEAILARRLPLGVKLLRSARRNPVIAGLSLTLVMVLVAVALFVPRFSRSYELTSLSGQLQRQLQTANWTPDDLPVAESIGARLKTLSPADGDEAHRLIAGRLDQYIVEMLELPRLGNQERERIEVAVAGLERYDAALADQRKPEVDRRFGQWERVADLKPPFARAAELVRGVSVTSDGQALIGGPTGIGLSTQVCDGNFQIEATLDLSPGAEATLLLNYRDMQAVQVTAVAVHPLGEQFASSGSDGVIRIWEAATGLPLFTLRGHEGIVGSLAYFANGQLLASSGIDRRVRIWNLAEKRQQAELDVSAPLATGAAPLQQSTPLAIAGSVLCAGVGDGASLSEVRRWSLPDLTPYTALSAGGTGVTHLATDRGGRRLAAGTLEGAVRVWDLDNDRVLLDVPASGHYLTAVALSPDGETLAITAPLGLVHVTRVSDGSRLHSLQAYEAGSYALAFSPDGTTLAAGYENGTIKFWDWQVGQVAATLRDYRNRCLSLAYEASGQWGVAGSQVGTISVWDAATATERYMQGDQSYAFHVRRALNGPTVDVAIMRGSELLRQETLPLPAGPVKVVARRADHELSLQLASHPAVVFHDLLPPRTVVDGVWGLMLKPPARATALVVRRAPAESAAAASQLEAGDRLFRAGRFTEALDAFDQQLAQANSKAAVLTRQEAQLKGARCLVRLNRTGDALARLRDLAGQLDPTPLVVLARFELWKQLLVLGKYRDASDIFATIQAQHDLSTINLVLAESPRQEIILLYRSRLSMRRSMLEPGLRPKLNELLAVTEYFDAKVEDPSDELLLLGQRQSIEDFAGVAQQAAAIFARQEVATIWPAEPAQAPSQMWDKVRDWCLVGRLADRHDLVAQGLDSLLRGPSGSWRNDLTPYSKVLLVERARSHYHLGEDSAAIDCLTHMLSEPTADPYSFHARLEGWLLLGFARERSGDAAAAQEAWQQGAAELIASSEELRALITSGREVVLELSLLSLAGKLDEAQYQRFIKYAASRFISVASGDQILKQLAPSQAVLQHLFLRPRGRRLAEQVAEGTLFVHAQVKELLIVLAARMLADGAFGAAMSADQEQLAWDLARSGFFAFADDQLSLPTLLQLGLAWKGVPSPFGWKLALSGLPEPARGPAAYVLSHRMSKHGRASDADALLKLAAEISAPESLAGQLAKPQ